MVEVVETEHQADPEEQTEEGGEDHGALHVGAIGAPRRARRLDHAHVVDRGGGGDVGLVGAGQHVLEEGLVLVVLALDALELEGLPGEPDGLFLQLLDEANTTFYPLENLDI